MNHLTNYGGKLPFPPRIQDLFDSLQREGFEVDVTRRQQTGKKLWTLHILWRGVQVGYTKQDMWSESGGRVLLGYKFSPGTNDAKDRCPADFDLNAFSGRLECAPLDFFIREDEADSKCYLRICSLAATLKVLLASRREIDQQLFDNGEADLDRAQKDLEQELAETRNRKDITETTKKRLVDARLGQGRFRSDLERVFNAGCAVTGVRLVSVG